MNTLAAIAGIKNLKNNSSASLAQPVKHWLYLHDCMLISELAPNLLFAFSTLIDKEEQMEIFKRTLMIAISSLLLAISSYPCCAADSAIGDLGGLAETPPERTLLVFTSNSEQLDYLSNDAATDALRAANSTVARPAKSLIAIENGSVTISFPAISPEFQGNNAKGFAGVIVRAELISGTF